MLPEEVPNASRTSLIKDMSSSRVWPAENVAASNVG